MRKTFTSITGIMAAIAASLITLSIILTMTWSATGANARGDGVHHTAGAVAEAALAGAASPFDTNWG